MKRIYLLTILLATLFACNNDNSLKQKELELKERELQIREKELQQKESSKIAITSSEQQTKQHQTETATKRKLRYLFYANGGLIGYFSDGTVSACPRCDLMKENIEALYSSKPFKKYYVESDGTLLVNGHEREYPKKDDKNSSEGWAMIDYKWLVDL